MIKAPQTQRGVRLVFEAGFKRSGLKLARTRLTGHSGIGEIREAPEGEVRHRSRTERTRPLRPDD